MTNTLKQEYEALSERIKDIELEAINDTDTTEEQDAVQDHANRLREILSSLKKQANDPNGGALSPQVLSQIHLTREISRELKDTQIELELNRIKGGQDSISLHYTNHINVLQNLLKQLNP